MGQDLERDKLKIELKLESAQFSRSLKVKFPNLPLNGKNIFRFTILTENTPLQFKNGARNLKKKLDQMFNHFLNFEPLSSFTSELNPKF